MDSTKLTTEMENLKNKLRATWMAGDFGQIARGYAIGAREFVERLGLGKGMRVLDAACGTGNLSFPAARTGARVIGIDIAPNLIRQATDLNEAEKLNADFDIGDVEDMPYDDASFDVVMTMFGAMFAPRPDVTAAELVRVCKPGGLIAMANWTPEGFIGQMFKTTGKHVPPPAGMPSPILWGTEDAVRERFAGTAKIETTKRTLWFTFPFGTNDTVEFFRMYYGPTQKAFAALDTDGQAALRSDLEALWAAANKATDGTTKVESEYLEVKVVR